MAIARRSRRRLRVETARRGTWVFGQPEAGKMSRVEHAREVHVHDLKGWRRRFGSVKVLAHLEDVRACYARVRDDAIQTAMWAQLDGLFEEIDLRLPIRHAAS